MKDNRSQRRKQRQQRRLTVRSIRRNPVDVKKLAGVLIELAQAQAAAEAQAEDERKQAVRQRRSERQHPEEDPDGGEA